MIIIIIIIIIIRIRLVFFKAIIRAPSKTPPIGDEATVKSKQSQYQKSSHKKKGRWIIGGTWTMYVSFIVIECNCGDDSLKRRNNPSKSPNAEPFVSVRTL
jgi:hypothetical protein